MDNDVKVKVIIGVDSNSFEKELNEFISYRKEDIDRYGKPIIKTHKIVDIKFSADNGYTAFIQYKDNVKYDFRKGVGENGFETTINTRFETSDAE